jgi:hypothetical protein
VRVLRNHKENSLEIYGRRGGGEFIGTYLHWTKQQIWARHWQCLENFSTLLGKWKVMEGVFYCTMIYVGPEHYSSQSGYRSTLTTTHKIDNISESMITRSHFEYICEVLKPRRCLVFHFHTTEKLFADENKLPFKLEIY